MPAVIILQPEQREVMAQALADAVSSYTRQYSPPQEVRWAAPSASPR